MKIRIADLLGDSIFVDRINRGSSYALTENIAPSHLPNEQNLTQSEYLLPSDTDFNFSFFGQVIEQPTEKNITKTNSYDT